MVSHQTVIIARSPALPKKVSDITSWEVEAALRDIKMGQQQAMTI